MTNGQNWLQLTSLVLNMLKCYNLLAYRN